MSNRRHELAPVRGRITKGQRAAICGLILAGIPWSYACNIAGVQHERKLADYIGADWRKRIAPRLRWTGDQIAELDGYWRDPSLKVATIADLFNVTPHRLWKVARENNLPYRRPPPNPKSIWKRPKVERNAYKKLREEFGTARARQEMGAP